jgi:hypothetical protein
MNHFGPKSYALALIILAVVVLILVQLPHWLPPGV